MNNDDSIETYVYFVVVGNSSLPLVNAPRFPVSAYLSIPMDANCKSRAHSDPWHRLSCCSLSSDRCLTPHSTSRSCRSGTKIQCGGAVRRKAS